LLKMLGVIKHRGHDDVGTYLDNGIGLGCDRLAIVDVGGGHQPAANEEGNICVVLNGEIYNHRELRALLQQNGHRFNSLSDTEVIVHAYEEWGAQSFARLDGMFGLAIWDSTKRVLTIVRDRIGIKPLYYTHTSGVFAFASEAKAILAAGLIETPTVNSSAVTHLLEVGYLLSPMSMLKEVDMLPPASFLTFIDNAVRITSYWKPPVYDSKAPPVEAIREAVKNCVVAQTVTSDIPVAAFLSGGLDTSTVVAFASRARPEGLKTFCMGFGENTDEFEDAKLVAQQFGTDHHELLIDASQGMKLFPKMIWHSEMPKVNLYSWFVNEAASRYGKVCLSGLGGDELFCGYANTSRFRRARQVTRIEKLPFLRTLATMGSALPIARARYAKALADEPQAYSSIITGFTPSEFDPEIPDRVRMYFTGAGDFVQKMVRCEFHTKLPYDYLLVEDAMSMAHTLEVRVPLLDDHLVQLMLPVRTRYQMTGDSGKLLLCSAMKGILPEACFVKPKWGFSIDIYSWWNRAIREYAEKYIPESRVLRDLTGEWYAKVLHNMRSPVDPSRTRWYAMAWTMLGLDLWHKMFLDEQIWEPPTSW
jgi:asparagine synthase (glutamine-hydrolysing)